MASNSTFEVSLLSEIIALLSFWRLIIPTFKKVFLINLLTRADCRNAIVLAVALSHEIEFIEWYWAKLCWASPSVWGRVAMHLNA
jgi:hypothetical protein